MSAAPKRKMTAEEYLAIERTAEFKSEFFDGEMYPLHRGPDGMAGAYHSHNELKDNLIVEVGMRLKGSGCRSYSSDQRTQLSKTRMYAYPDIVIVCGKPLFDEEGDNLLNPKVVFEVLSPGTESYDRGFKFAQYKLQPTLTEYVLVSQDTMRIERYERQSDGTWAETIYADPDSVFELTTAGVNIPLSDIYRDVDLAGTPSA